MGQPFEVDTDALRALAASLNGEADRIAGVDPSAAIGAVAAGMPGSAVGAAAGRACTPLLDAYRVRTDALREMAAAARSSADGYADTDNAFRASLGVTGGGL
ncbi:type VII secretion target [Rhodococcus gannanensis]|uniref:Type VII secretion target n=1 Tax=Rhodococcus gannanensis TaxID=1960308 RepID=A0ABW4NY80_9NOCA